MTFFRVVIFTSFFVNVPETSFTGNIIHVTKDGNPDLVERVEQGLFKLVLNNRSSVPACAPI